MQFEAKICILVIGACLTLLSLANAVCETQKCFDCNMCNKDCTNVQQDCDSDCLVQTRQFLCKMENENCKKVRGCDIPPIPITVYPAAFYDVSKPAWEPLTILARLDCCYNFSGKHNDTLSGIKNSGACVKLYADPYCSGPSIVVDSGFTPYCLSWIDCPDRLNAGGIAFNDKTSSFELC